MRYALFSTGCTLVATALLAGAAHAQQAPQGPPPIPAVAASSWASTEVRFMGRYVYGGWMPRATGLAGPARVTITYGQPHARGRQIVGGVVPLDSVWRFGANEPTEMRTEVNLNIGGTVIPHGVYTLWALPTASGWQLVVNKEVGQFGTPRDYNASMDVARIPMTVKKLEQPVESFTITLVPNVLAKDAPADTPASGVLKAAWGDTEVSVGWTVADWK